MIEMKDAAVVVMMIDAADTMTEEATDMVVTEVDMTEDMMIEAVADMMTGATIDETMATIEEEEMNVMVVEMPAVRKPAETLNVMIVPHARKVPVKTDVK